VVTLNQSERARIHANVPTLKSAEMPEKSGYFDLSGGPLPKLNVEGSNPFTRFDDNLRGTLN
jgi:hypothetical protein